MNRNKLVGEIDYNLKKNNNTFDTTLKMQIKYTIQHIKFSFSLHIVIFNIIFHMN